LDYTARRRTVPIKSIWDRKIVNGQYSIRKFLREHPCGLIDDSCENEVTREVWNKLTNILILASLSPPAAGRSPLLIPLTKTHLKHPR
jgi:hypothetical protein